MKKIQPLFGPRLATSNGSAPGDPEASGADVARFREIILPHLDGAYNLARYLTRDPVLSEDVVQDAFLRAFRNFGQMRGESPRAWLFAIVRNCCRSAQTAPAAARLVHESDLSEADSSALANHVGDTETPEDHAIREGEIANLRAAIEALPEPFREAIVLRDIEDLSYAEIARVTEVAIGTVMSRLSRARAMLAKVLLPAAAAQEEDDSERNVKQ